MSFVVEVTIRNTENNYLIYAATAVTDDADDAIEAAERAESAIREYL